MDAYGRIAMASFFMQERVRTICHPPWLQIGASAIDLNIKIRVIKSRSYPHNVNEETKIYQLAVETVTVYLFIYFQNIYLSN